jgi:hypothetical protein
MSYRPGIDFELFSFLSLGNGKGKCKGKGKALYYDVYTKLA